MTFRGLSQDIVETIIDVNNGQATQTYDQAGNSEYDVSVSTDPADVAVDIGRSTDDSLGGGGDSYGTSVGSTYGTIVSSRVYTSFTVGDFDAVGDPQLEVNGNVVASESGSVEGASFSWGGSASTINATVSADTSGGYGAIDTYEIVAINVSINEASVVVDSINKN